MRRGGYGQAKPWFRSQSCTHTRAELARFAHLMRQPVAVMAGAASRMRPRSGASRMDRSIAAAKLGSAAVLAVAAAVMLAHSQPVALTTKEGCLQPAQPQPPANLRAVAKVRARCVRCVACVIFVRCGRTMHCIHDCKRIMVPYIAERPSAAQLGGASRWCMRGHVRRGRV